MPDNQVFHITVFNSEATSSTCCECHEPIKDFACYGEACTICGNRYYAHLNCRFSPLPNTCPCCRNGGLYDVLTDIGLM